MKNNIKKISVVSLILICTFSIVVLSSASFAENSSANAGGLAKISLETLQEGVSPLIIERYPEKESKNVSAKLDSLLDRINKRHDFNGAILVAKNDKILYSNQVGMADFNKKTPLNKESVFQLASVSKQFTAAAIMLLHEQHKIKLTDTVNAYFPGFPYEGVTIENLLNHTAGLPKYFWVSEHKWNQEKAPSNSEMMSLLQKSNVQRFFEPGHNFDYSNTNYFVLASIVEKVSGTSFSSFLKKNIFDPLEMDHSFVYSFENDSINENQLDGYRLYRGWRHLKIGGTVNDAVVGDKNVYTTAEDLFKWTLGLNTGKLLSKASLDLMYAEGKTISGRTIPYGFGFRIDNKRENTIYHHGRWNGFSTALTTYLDDDLVVIVLEHTSYKSMRSLNAQIKKIVTENLKT
ncbi:serine hydrolase [Sediminibacter sp. Hel_I_10]|uniref:serine hydrolase domain-containing protein n=1 Tax=Sediminibacter sp. Hel_I_10 TaxID=1392490 RepID=UPI000479B546|nr:serine hydrolase domain-containing protein [Sediminibacter sp. Hel_I_10]